ncbi:hypothetical protein [Oribacterium sp. C9]|uniref:hypothetical protein n=1 Tax=Oribacterium sp. C9 TaxID=1943579 RepID=UPI00143900B3|nr:hypothetical protein [Oribacterium sp. C9]
MYIWGAREINQLHYTGTNGKFEPLSEDYKEDEQDEELYKQYYGLSVKSTASTAAGTNHRYATVAYAVTCGYETVIVGFDPIFAPGPNGAKQKELNFIKKEDLRKAAENQGVKDPDDFVSIVFEERHKDGTPIKTFVSTHALFVVTHNGTQGINKRYANGRITYSPSGETLVDGEPLKALVMEKGIEGANKILSLTFHDQILTEEMKQYAGGQIGLNTTNTLPPLLADGFSSTAQNDIKRNANRAANRIRTTQEIIIPPVPKRGDPGIFTTYHTWDNTTKDRTQAHPYYVTYNDSRTYEDADGHHDAFTEEDGHGIVIPSGEKLINGAENDAYWGSLSFEIKESRKTFSATYEYDWTYMYWEPHHEWVSTKNGGHWRGGWEYQLITNSKVPTSTTRQAYTYALAAQDSDLYTFESTKTYNDAFTAGSKMYTSKNHHTINSPIAPSNTGPVNDGVTTTVEQPQYIMTTGNITWQDVNPKGNDLELGHIGTFKRNPLSKARELAEENMMYHVGDGINESHLGGTDIPVQSFASVTTDRASIIYGGQEKNFLEGKTTWARFDNSNYTYKDVFGKNNAEQVPYLTPLYPPNKFLESTGGGVDVNTFEASPAFKDEQIKIPENQANGDYPTSVDAKYIRAITTGNVVLGKNDKKDFGKEGKIKADYKHNEPVRVQTPVIAPVEIYRDNGENLDSSNPKVSSAERDAVYTGGAVNKKIGTQLVAGKEHSNIPQLRLDETYWFKFSTRSHA